MAYVFNMLNTTQKEITVYWYDWNDGSHLIAAGTYHISSKGNADINALDNVVIQMDLYDKKNKVLGGIWQNFYATKRPMQIVEKEGIYSIEYRKE
ncbi:hypothetical protein [Lewinella sp. LCG006]|uniref:hypothetical protein n=1 Tax=Lewinella sp. LCG006 TaxID=3231911 RepID=UPI003460D8CA